jgi:hypothetical protein
MYLEPGYKIWKLSADKQCHFCVFTIGVHFPTPKARKATKSVLTKNEEAITRP